MDRRGTWQALYVVMATAVLSMAREERCHQQIVLEADQTVHSDVIHMTSERRDCVIEFSAKAGWRVVLTFDYKPPVTSVSVAEDCAFTPDYLLIGNDVTAIGQELMTSYKFCRETEEEIVSRDNRLWLVLRDSQHKLRPQRHLLTLNATALPQVSCSADELECSPVQCVPNSAVCDGHTDCLNGRDEYCYDFNMARESTISKEDHHQNQNHHHHYHHHHQSRSQERQLPSLPPEDSTCFLCRDGTCILPRLPRYAYNWGVWSWYLCDGVPHCPDGWDEQAYMCYLSRHFPQLAQSHLFQCQAFDLPASSSRQVRMWSLARCDGRRDCRAEEEETGGDRCDDVLGVARSDAVSRSLYMNPLALSLVVLFAVIIIISAVFILRQFDHLTGRTNRTRGILRDPGREDQPGCSSEVSSCLAVKSCIVVDRTALPSLANRDFERLRETSV